MDRLNLDTQREVLSKMSDYDLLKTCNADPHLRNKICDDNFFHKILLNRYPNSLKYKSPDATYRAYYISIIFNIARMKEKHNFIYSFGNPKVQYELLENEYDRSGLLINSSKSGELALVIEALKRGANIHQFGDLAVRNASANGHLEVVKYLVEKGANIHVNNDQALRWASDNGHLEVVKYLVQKGANIHANNDIALRWASDNGHLEVVKYLQSL